MEQLTATTRGNRVGHNAPERIAASKYRASKTAAGQGLRWFFFRPPRRHGEVDYDREVSFLELFYDLVYVVIIGQAAHHLATHVSWTGLRDFVVVFGLIWLAWFNGTFWHEVHGREDGRSRTNIFIQMGLIALLAVYTGHATDTDGPAFATVYIVFFAWYTYQWWAVHRIDDPVYPGHHLAAPRRNACHDRGDGYQHRCAR